MVRRQKELYPICGHQTVVFVVIYALCCLLLVYIAKVTLNPVDVSEKPHLKFWQNSLEKIPSKYRNTLRFIVKSLPWVYNYSENLNLEEKIPSQRPVNQTTMGEVKRKKASRNQNNVIDAERTKILTNQTLPLLTLFTTWVPSRDTYVCHNNTVINWRMLHPFVKTVLFTNDKTLAKQVITKEWHVLPVSKSNIGIPILKNMFIDAMKHFNTKLYGFANSDILFTDSLVATLLSALKVFQTKSSFLVVGRRTNVLGVKPIEASSSEKLRMIVKQKGRMFTEWGLDYFITPPSYPWTDIPEVVVGRRAYDNWIVANAKQRRIPTIDATLTNLAVHQNTVFDDVNRRRKNNKLYNHRLFTKLNKVLNYASGMTSSTRFFTTFNKLGSIEIKVRVRT